MSSPAFYPTTPGGVRGTTLDGTSRRNKKRRIVFDIPNTARTIMVRKVMTNQRTISTLQAGVLDDLTYLLGSCLRVVEMLISPPGGMLICIVPAEDTRRRILLPHLNPARPQISICTAPLKVLLRFIVAIATVIVALVPDFCVSSHDV
jgi:hypothetical protein